jgi:hypothetical protein
MTVTTINRLMTIVWMHILIMMITLIYLPTHADLLSTRNSLDYPAFWSKKQNKNLSSFLANNKQPSPALATESARALKKGPKKCQEDIVLV